VSPRSQLVQLIMFCVTYVTVNILNVLLWLECSGTETSAPLVDGIVSNALFHSNSHIRCRLKSFKSCAFSNSSNAQIL